MTKLLLLICLGFVLPSMGQVKVEGVNSGNGNLRQSLKDLFPQQEESYQQEELSLRGYLRGRDGRYDRYRVEVEIARLKQQRRNFPKYLKEWNKDRRNDRDVREYWDNYYRGYDYALEIAPRSDEESCKRLLNLANVGWMPNPPSNRRDPYLKDAFIRGTVAARSDCYLENVVERMEGLEDDLATLQRKLFDIQRDLRSNRLRGRDLEKLRSELAALLKGKFEDLVNGYIPDLKKSVALPEGEWTRLQAAAERISSAIGCDNLRNRRTGQKYVCAINNVPPQREMNFASAYRVLVKGQQTGIYQETLLMRGLFEALAYYKAEVQPTDEIIDTWVNDIKSILENMDSVSSRRIANLTKRFQDDRRKMIQEFDWDNSEIDNKFFDSADRDETIRYFYDLREQIEVFERRLTRFDKGEDFQARVSFLQERYSTILNIAGTIELLIQLPAEDIVVNLDTELFETESIGIRLPALNGGFLLGRDASEASEWLKDLAFQR